MKVKRRRLRPIIKVYMVASLFIIPIVMMGITFSNWAITYTQPDTNDIVAGCFSLDFTDDNSISLTNAYPLGDTQGLKTTPYEFSLDNSCSLDADVFITLDIFDVETTLDLSKAKVSLDGETPVILSTLTPNYNITDSAGIRSSYILKQDMIEVEQTKSYNLRLWLDIDAGNESMNKTLKARVSIVSAALTTVSIPKVAISGPFTTSGGSTDRIWAKAGDIGYYSIVVDSKNAYVSDLTKITVINSNATRGTITGSGTVSNPYIVPVTASAGGNGTTGIQVGVGAFIAEGTLSNELSSSNTFTVDTQVPVITVVGTSLSFGEGSSGALAFNINSDVSVTDNLDTTITFSAVSSPPYNPSVIGTYTITYSATDAAGNVAATKTRTVDITVNHSGKSLTNLLANGGFESNTTGWTTASYSLGLVALSTLSPSHGGPGTQVMGITGSANADVQATYTAVSGLTVGRKYYLSAWVRTGNTNVTGAQWYNNTTAIAGSNITFGQNAWTRMSYVWTSTATSFTPRVFFTRANGNNAKLAYVDNVMMIDLTASYGAGNEPTATVMDSILTGSYSFFDGTWVVP